MPSAEPMTPPTDWEEAGRAWGLRPADWAYLFEPYARPANEVIFDRLGVGEGTRLLDIACGSGLAAQTAARRGAAVTGIDASDALVTIARARTAGGDFRVGDMFALPFPDAASTRRPASTGSGRDARRRCGRRPGCWRPAGGSGSPSGGARSISASCRTS